MDARLPFYIEIYAIITSIAALRSLPEAERNHVEFKSSDRVLRKCDFKIRSVKVGGNSFGLWLTTIHSYSV